jgi:hypothetical protein
LYTMLRKKKQIDTNHTQEGSGYGQQSAGQVEDEQQARWQVVGEEVACRPRGRSGDLLHWGQWASRLVHAWGLSVSPLA